MPEITLDLSDAAELAEMLTFLASWLSGSQKPVLDKSLAAYAGHPAYNTDTLRADLHPVRLPPRRNRRRRTLRGAGPMNGKIDTPRQELDTITRITPNRRWWAADW